jgi:hypothetical protein
MKKRKISAIDELPLYQQGKPADTTILPLMETAGPFPNNYGHYSHSWDYSKCGEGIFTCEVIFDGWTERTGP